MDANRVIMERFNYSVYLQLLAGVHMPYKQIKLSKELYDKLAKLKQELNVRTFGEVIGELINMYEGFKSYRSLSKLLQLISNAQQIVSELSQVLSTINQNRYEIVKSVVSENE
jgi:predicted CopG family antitoxin